MSVFVCQDVAACVRVCAKVYSPVCVCVCEVYCPVCVCVCAIALNGS